VTQGLSEKNLSHFSEIPNSTQSHTSCLNNILIKDVKVSSLLLQIHHVICHNSCSARQIPWAFRRHIHHNFPPPTCHSCPHPSHQSFQMTSGKTLDKSVTITFPDRPNSRGYPPCRDWKGEDRRYRSLHVPDTYARHDQKSGR
jgi:hypothetical protein